MLDITVWMDSSVALLSVVTLRLAIGGFLRWPDKQCRHVLRM
ncbi:hypothetical protein IMCC3088_883 [Aequoribacter fuscus]|uniref:Uncharacterized protein n=1 Tax=Aequoribacter fuscus TaxID=2518989 RepID=F3L0G2_9GAMM|nr:hypothetical protein IMCC3088_883 [Aequoribacter fuscus]